MRSHQGQSLVGPAFVVMYGVRVSAVVGDILLGLGVDETKESQLHGLHIVGDLNITSKYKSRNVNQWITKLNTVK